MSYAVTSYAFSFFLYLISVNFVTRYVVTALKLCFRLFFNSCFIGNMVVCLLKSKELKVTFQFLNSTTQLCNINQQNIHFSN